MTPSPSGNPLPAQWAERLPPPLAALGATPADVVWVNQLGGITVRLGDTFAKWGHDFTAERERLAWAARHARVPRVVAYGADWLQTAALPGESAVAPRWLAEPLTAVRAIGRGLRALHDVLPVAECPFGRDFPGAPPADRLVVCHGDACAPNTLVAADGSFAGHVDLGALGVADRWADLAIATWSTLWNYGPGFEEPLLEAYGIGPDPERTAWYRAAWEATP